MRDVQTGFGAWSYRQFEAHPRLFASAMVGTAIAVIGLCIVALTASVATLFGQVVVLLVGLVGITRLLRPVYRHYQNDMDEYRAYDRHLSTLPGFADPEPVAPEGLAGELNVGDVQPANPGDQRALDADRPPVAKTSIGSQADPASPTSVTATTAAASRPGPVDEPVSPEKATDPAPLANPMTGIGSSSDRAGTGSPDDRRRGAFQQTTFRAPPAAETDPAAIEALRMRLGDLDDSGLRHPATTALGQLGDDRIRHEASALSFQPELVATDSVGRRAMVRVVRQPDGGETGVEDLRRYLDKKKARHRLERGVHVTSGRYTTEAIRLGRQHDLTLVDGDDLATVPGAAE